MRTAAKLPDLAVGSTDGDLEAAPRPGRLGLEDRHPLKMTHRSPANNRPARYLGAFENA